MFATSQRLNALLLACLVIVAPSVAASAAATQFLANVFHHQPALGEALSIAGLRLYWPWSWVIWDDAWAQIYPRPFALAQLEKVIGESLILKEVVLLFIRVWLEHNPPIEEHLEESAAASAEARFERFLDFVAQQLSPGKSLGEGALGVTHTLSLAQGANGHDAGAGGEVRS